MSKHPLSVQLFLRCSGSYALFLNKNRSNLEVSMRGSLHRGGTERKMKTGFQQKNQKKKPSLYWISCLKCDLCSTHDNDCLMPETEIKHEAKIKNPGMLSQTLFFFFFFLERIVNKQECVRESLLLQRRRSERHLSGVSLHVRRDWQPLWLVPAAGIMSRHFLLTAPARLLMARPAFALCVGARVRG